MEPTIKYETCDEMYAEQETANVRQPAASGLQGNNNMSAAGQHYYNSQQHHTQPQQNNLKRGYSEMDNDRNNIDHLTPANGSAYYPPVDFAAIPQHTMQDNFDLFNHPNALMDNTTTHSTFRTDNKPMKKYKRGEASILFNPPFYKLVEGFSSGQKDAIAARCYACGKIVKGNRSISSNFIKHMKRGHPEISKIYDSYKIYRIKTGQLPNISHMLEGKIDLNKSGSGGTSVGMGTGSACGDSNEDNNSFFEATNILDNSEIGDEEKQSENSEDNEDSLNMTRDNSENNENSKESQQPSQQQYENVPVELSDKTLEAIGKLMDEKLQNFVKQSDFEQLSLKVEHLNNKETLLETSHSEEIDIISSPALGALKKELESVKQECAALRLAVQQSQASKRQLQNELQTVDKMLHQRKLIIRNIKIVDPSKPLKTIEKLFRERLHLDDIKIINCTIIPSTKSTPESCKECICIELQNPQDAKEIFRQTHKLKDTGIFIESEISPFQRKRKDKLMVLRKELLRRKPELKVLVRNTTLVVNGKNFYWDDVEGLCHDSYKDAIELSAVEYLKSLTTLDLSEFINILQNYNIQMR